MELLLDNATFQIYILHTSGHIQVSEAHRVDAGSLSLRCKKLIDLPMCFFVCFFFIASRFALRFIRPDPRGRVTDPVGDVVSFIHSFEEQYGRSHPVFYQGTYSQVSLVALSANGRYATHILML